MFCTVNAKVKAKRAKLLTAEDYGAMISSGQIFDGAALEHDAARLMHYINERPAKKFIKSMAAGLANGKTDIDYYLSLWRSLDALDKVSQHAMKRVIGVEIDLRNILWMYRLKRHYNIVGGATYGHLIPLGNKTDMTTRMAECKNVAGLLAEISHSLYSGVFGDFSHGEQRLVDAVKKQYRKQSRQYPNSIVVVCGYLYEKYVETRNITAIIEGVRQNVGVKEIVRQLVFDFTI